MSFYIRAYPRFVCGRQRIRTISCPQEGSEEQVVEILTRTPIGITEQIEELCSELYDRKKPRYVPVQPDPNSEINECFFNVRAKMEREGGDIQFGWTIWEWPRIMIEAVFHAIWISPNKEQIDITPKRKNVSSVLFLPDGGRTYDYSHKLRQIDNVRRPLSNNPLVAEFIVASEQIFEFEEKHFPGRYIDPNNPAFGPLGELKEKRALIGLRLQSQCEPCPDYSKSEREDSCSCGTDRIFKKRRLVLP